MLLITKQVRENYNISRLTLLNWEREGLIHPLKTPKGVRRYLKNDLDRLLGGKTGEDFLKKVILYACVSTKKQEAYLRNQIQRLDEPYEIISEIASGVNEKGGSE